MLLDKPAMAAEPHRPTQPTRLALWCVSGLIALVVFLVFANSLLNTFLWDDEQFIVKNAFLTSPTFLGKLLTENIVSGAGLVSNLYRPLQSLTHFFDVQVWSYRPWGHHLSTILFHVAASVAVFRLLARLYPVWPAAIATLLFAVHPLQSEAVAYTCGRGDALAILFISLGLLACHRHPWLGFLSALCAMASKEYGVLFPVLLFLYERANGQPVPWKRHLPFWGLSGIYVLARLTIFNFKDTLNFYDRPNVLTEHITYRLYTYLTTLPKGLFLWLWPSELHHERSWSVYTSLLIPRVWLSLLVVLALVGAAVWCWKRVRPIAIGIAWFFIATVPTSNVIVLINALFYDHWFILPGLGLIIAVGYGLSRALGGPSPIRHTITALSLGILVACSTLTVRHNRIWRTPVTLYTHILSQEPRSAKIHNNLAMAYAEEGQFDKAIQLYHQAIALDDTFPETHHNVGNAYLNLGDETRALEAFERAVAMNPRFHHSWVQLGMIHLRRHDLEQAAAAFTRTIEAYPYAAEAYLGLAQVRRAQGDVQAAHEAVESGLRILPNHPALQAAREQLHASRQ